MVPKPKVSLFLLVAIAVTASMPPAFAGADACPAGLNQIDYAMYFLSDVRDAEQCAQKFGEGGWTTPDGVVNPAMTCPDMFSWRLYINSVRDQFWTRWADEEQNWPAEPYPLCAHGGVPGKTCCEPGSPKNPTEHCPVFPGDRPGSPGHSLAAEAGVAARPAMRIGRPSILHQLNEMAGISGSQLETQLRALAPMDDETPECPASILDKLIPQDPESIGRVIRQTNAEITVRDRPFHNYLFENNLYNSNGVKAVFANNGANVSDHSPYRRASRAATPGDPKADLSRIDLPPEAIMIKSNWLYAPLAHKLGIEEDPKHPFIKKRVATMINLTKDRKEKCLLQGVHYLIAFHVSSKDIPNWVWATFEHVDLPGRCDITGCNDSYGFCSSDTLPEGAADNYIKPLVHWDDLNEGSCVFDRNELYPPEQIKKPFAALLDQLEIGVRPSTDPDEPTPQDLGWRSYRLKGSQVEFTNSMGRSTFLGNSVTEAGFMDGSSCITCHSRAGIHVDENGTDSTFFKLGVFENSLSDFGYGRSAHGIPNKNWFHDSAQPPKLDVLQTDFVWGFLFAKPLVEPR